MALALDLSSSPFAVLNVTPRDNRSVIAEAFERAMADGVQDEMTLIRAQQILMAPKMRLAAELEWILGVAPARARQFLRIEAVRADALVELPSLAAANLAAYGCSAGHQPALQEFILSFQISHSVEEILALVNSERAAAGFPPVEEGLVIDGLSRLSRVHIDALLNSIVLGEKPGHALSSVMDQCFHQEGRIVSFVEELAERFDVWASTGLQLSRNRIDLCLSSLRTDPSRLSELKQPLEAECATWGDLSGPRQIGLGYRHLNDAKTDQLWQDVLGLSIHRECREFRVRAVIMGRKECQYVPTQRACDTE